MLTSATRTVGRPAVVKDDRPGYRPFSVHVAGVRELGPHFTRVTFTGPDLAWFGTDGQDQRVKILFPVGDRPATELALCTPEVVRAGTWYALWRDLPEAERCPFRTYTVRAVRPEAGEVDVDMVRHADGGPGARWAATARPGDEVVLVGPDARSRDSRIGIDWAPGGASELLLAGDETAAPAICAILESLPRGRRARAFIEVPEQGDALPVDLPDGAEVTWLAREGHPHGHRLVPAVQEWVARNADVVSNGLSGTVQSLEDVDVDTELLWDSPAARVLPVDTCARGAERCGQDFYAWFAGEAGVIRSLRRLLVSHVGVCRKRVAFMGYWRLGRAEAQ